MLGVSFVEMSDCPLTVLAAGSVLPFSRTAIDAEKIPLGRVPLYKPLARLSTESTRSFLLQTMFPFLAAGFGMIGAGVLLDHAAEWTLFQSTPELFILVPALLGLKGNLEMTLASRLSTMSNLGKMDTRHEQFRVFYANIALTQAQAIVVSFVASLFAVGVSFIQRKQIELSKVALLCASSTATATTASLLIGSAMFLVVYASKRLKANPDNVATPVAASLGDLTTLSILVVVGTWLLEAQRLWTWNSAALALFLLLLAPLWALVAARDDSTLPVLRAGWWPILAAMLISSAGGFILKFAIVSFPDVAIFQPVVNGIGGNLVAVQASRISTSLFQSSKMGSLNGDSFWRYFSVSRAFFSAEADSKTARILLCLSVPGQLLFALVIVYVAGLSLDLFFLSSYLTAALLQVLALLFVCQFLVRLLWGYNVDPDSASIPLLTALGDLLGIALLTTTFFLVDALAPKERLPPF
ncbi:hypothetical protein QR680_009344 [Steinernema hermaphroditum]|uniref:SLC41A/MgtE integral membrane domain-containing protein n=1 Tax=Steinernema hermaphroditum TaxID=289476 RepID=A0AA39IJZ1_9BILA|nr:hypothetical protein QR680_009344 [Steinernema hermaphroditum]